MEIGQILGSFEGDFAVVGGAVPWLLLEAAYMQHVGTIDIDLTLDAEALGDGDYVRLIAQAYGFRTVIQIASLVALFAATVLFLSPRQWLSSD